MSFWYRSLRTRLIIYFLLLSIIPFGVVSVIVYQQGLDAMQQTAVRQLETAAVLKEQEIDSWITRQEQLVRLWAQTPIVLNSAATLLSTDEISDDFQAAYADLSDYLNESLAETSDFLEIFVLTDVGGEVIFSTDDEHEGDFHVTDTFFVEGRKDTHVQNIYFSPTLNQQTMTISTPLVDDDGQTIGVLAAHLDLEQLNNIILERSGLGQTGETYLVDDRNVFVSQVRGGSEEFPRGVHTVGIDRALMGENGSEIYDNYRDAKVVGVYRWLEEQELALLAEMETVEAFADINRIAGIITTTGLGILVVVAISIYFVANRISKPVLKMVTTAEQVASGDLEQRVDVETKDEIGALGVAFNDMTAQLQTTLSSLEQRVAARTQDLELANEIGRTVAEIRSSDRLLSEAVTIIRNKFDLYLVQIYLFDDTQETLVLHAAAGQAANRLLAQGHFLAVNTTSINGTAVSERQAVVVSNTRQDPLFRPNPLLPNTRSEMAVPLLTADKAIGVLDLQSSVADTFTEENVPAFTAMAGQLAIALENASLFHERETSAQALEEALKNVESQAKRFRVLNQLGAALTTAKNLDEVYEIVGSQILDIIEGNRAGLSLLSPDKTTFQMIVLTGAEKGFRSGNTMPLEGTAVYEAIKQNHVLRLPKDTPLSTYKDARKMAQQGMQSALIAPLTVSGQVIGTMNIGSKRPFTFSNADESFIQQIATLLASTIDSLRLLERVQRLATIVENHPDFIGVGTLDGHTIYINPSGLAMLGLPADYDVSTITAADFYLEEDAITLQQEGIPAALEFGSWTSEASLRKADGDILPVEETVAVNYDANNNPTGYSITMRDISDRKQAEQAQQRLNAQLEERLLQVNALQRAMTHEGWAAFLTSPNRLVQGYSFNNEQMKLISKMDLDRKNVPQPAEETAVPDALAVPVTIRGEQVGVIGVRNPEGEPITDEQASVIQAMTMQVAEALDRARLFEEMELARKQMNALYSGSEQVVRAQTLEEVLHALVDATALKRLDRVNFMFFDKSWTDEKPTTVTITAVWEKGSDTGLQPVGTQYLINQLPGGGRITKDKPAIFSNIAADENVDSVAKARAEQLNINSIVFFPLVVGGQWFGLLSAQSFSPLTLTEGDIRQITSLVDQAASVSQTQRLFAQARDRAHREQLLREVTARVYAAPDAETILKTAVKEVNRILGVDSFIYLDSPGTPEKNAPTPENGRSPAKENNAEQEG